MKDTIILKKIFESVQELKNLNGGHLDTNTKRNHAHNIEYARLYSRIMSLAKRVDIELPDPTRESTEGSMDSMLDAVKLIQISIALRLGEAEIEEELHQDTVELSLEEIEKIEDLIADARKKIRASELFNENHKTRLLRRLEKIQAEIHKKASDLDVALAAMVEIGSAVGDTAKNAEPAVGVIERIVGIFNSKISEPLQLPAPPKQIEDLRATEEE